MKPIAGIVTIVAVAIAVVWVWIPTADQDSPDPPDAPIVIYDTDTGADTAIKFMKSYARLIAAGIAPVISKQEAGEYDGTLAMAKEFAAAAEQARKSATEGVNARFASLKDSSPEEVTEFLKSFQTGMKEVGK